MEGEETRVALEPLLALLRAEDGWEWLWDCLRRLAAVVAAKGRFGGGGCWSCMWKTGAASERLVVG